MVNSQIILEMIRKQIKIPARAGINNESSFVKSKLAAAGHQLEATEYWNWACNPKSRPADKPADSPEWVTDELYIAHQELKKLDSKIVLAPWATGN